MHSVKPADSVKQINTGRLNYCTIIKIWRASNNKRPAVAYASELICDLRATTRADHEIQFLD